VKVGERPVVFHWLWEGRFGGAERIVAKAFLAHKESVFDHRVIIGESFGDVIGPGAGRYCLGMTHGADCVSLRKIAPILAAAPRKVLCLHQINPWLLAFAPARTPTIYTEHGQARMWRGPVRDLLWRLLWRRANRRIAGIVSVSDHARRTFLERNPSCNKPVTVIHNPLLIEPGAPRRAFPQRLRIAFCGRMIPAKGAGDVVSCAAILRDTLDAEFIIIGDGPERPRLERRSVQERLPVRFTGAVADVHPLLAETDILVAPSREDTFNLAVLEAMAIGAVPVVYPTGGMIEVVIHGETGVVCGEKTPASLALEIERLAENRDLLAQMSAAGFHRAVRAFGMDLFRRRWDAYLSGVLEISSRETRSASKSRSMRSL
jgi:glycosyltransferase involved in cell wall biosynthesis